MGVYYGIDEDENIIEYVSLDYSTRKIGNIKPAQKLNRGITGIYLPVNRCKSLFRRENTLNYVDEENYMTQEKILKKYGVCYVLFYDYKISYYELLVRPIAVSVLYEDIINIKKKREHIIEVLNDQ